MTIYKKNGKYYSRFKIHGEQKHFLCQGATTQAQAQAIEDAEKFKLRQQQAGLLRPEKSVSLFKLLVIYENYAKTNKRSYSKFDKPVINYVRSYFGATTNIKDIKISHIEKFKQHLIDKNLAPSTINKYLNLLSKAFNIGITEKIVAENPLRDIKRLREKNYKVRFLTKEEEVKLFKYIDEHAPNIKPLIITALQTGMRKGEIFNLKWSNIDFEYDFIELLETKSGKSRKIPISETLKNVLLNILKTHPKSEYVFINPETGNPYVDIKHSFHTVLIKAGIKNFRFHDLRHTVATRLVESGIDLIVVKEILGHSKIETTMRYAHPVPKRKLEAISVLNNYFMN